MRTIRSARPLRWLNRAILLFLIAGLPISGTEPAVERLYTSLSTQECSTNSTAVDRGRTLEEINHAYAWNRLLDPRVAAINYDFLTAPQVLSLVDSWAPQIACMATVFEIPPELLAGVMALELDLDYHPTDAVFDRLVDSPLGEIFSHVEVGAAYAGVHFKHLRPALQSFGSAFSSAPFYTNYYALVLRSSDSTLTMLSTRYRLIDLADCAVMARYYARLRMGDRPLSEMTITDMAFIWSAYRGGVTGTAADLEGPHRWSLDILRKADNPQVFGDTVIAVPYFSYYRQMFRGRKSNSASVARQSRGVF